MERSWRESTNPFPRATKAATEFWEKPLHEAWSETLLGRNYGYLLEEHIPNVFEEFQREFEERYLTFSESLPDSLRNLASAVRSLKEGKLRSENRNEISLIVNLGEDFIREAVAYFDEDKKGSEASYGTEVIDEMLPDHARYIDLLQMVRTRARGMDDFAKEFAKVAHQLDLDLKYQRSHMPWPSG